jgi:dihydrofolate synthase/folylpolyglutamate synthase
MTYPEALEFLYGLELFGVKLGLENITKFLKRIDNPQEHFKAIHIAGTNGKGSLASIFESILVEAGYKVGKFTSPHLYDFRERFHIDKHKVEQDRIAEFISDHHGYIKGTRTTFFETCTAFAFDLFRKESVDWAVVEVGLGGRLDATSLVEPDLTVITKIASDHIKTLGDSIAKIAYEKCGILKSGVPLVTSVEHPEAVKVITDRAAQKNVPVYHLDSKAKLILRNMSLSGIDFSYSPNSVGPHDYTSNLTGLHQAENCALALLGLYVLEQNGLKISDAAKLMGLNKIFWPARMQYIPRQPSLLLDCAHNPDGFASLAASVARMFPERKFNMLVGMLNRPDYPEIFATLKRIARLVILTIPENVSRAPQPEVLAREAIDSRLNFKLIPDVLEAYRYSREITEPDDILMVAGSHFSLGTIMKYENIPT